MKTIFSPLLGYFLTFAIADAQAYRATYDALTAKIAGK